MSRIQLLYKIIKSSDVSCEEDNRLCIDTKLDSSTSEESFLGQLSYEEDYDEDIIDIQRIKEEIREEVHRNLLIEIEQERLKIIEEARIEAEDIKLEARQQGYDDGLNNGYTEGFKNGLEKAEKEALTIKNSALDLVKQAEQHVIKYYSDNHDNIIKLAANMAESIVHNYIDESSENLVELIRPILQQFGKTENIIITTHPMNVAFIKCYLHQLEDSSPGARFIILEDNKLEKNGCIIENENQIIDLQVRKQIDSILKNIKEINTLE